MPLVNLSVSTATPPPEDPSIEKKPIKIRCLLFFDGTLNSRENIKQRELHEQSKAAGGKGSEIYLKNRANDKKEELLDKGAAGIDLEDDSYENDYSNIVRLEANVAPSQKGYDERIKVYVEGAGTLKYEPNYKYQYDDKGKLITDSSGKPKYIMDEFGNPKDFIGENKDQLGGFAFAAGESGIKPKVDRGIQEAIAAIVHGPNIDPRDNRNKYIEKLTIDIFGFSRGAASARYCAYRLLKAMGDGADTPAETYIEHAVRTLHMLDVKEVEIRFVGLFDTVVSYKAAQIIKFGGSLENWLTKQKAISHDKVKKVVHIASAEEHRDMFCLHNIDSAGGKGEEYFLPGVHSDIGGGYLPNGCDAGLKVTQAYRYWAQKDRDEFLVARGWFKDDELIEDWISLKDNGEPDYVELSVTRNKNKARVVQNAYCQIPLKIMAEKAGESDIEFLSDIKADATRAISKFDELTAIESRINGYVSSKGARGSTAEDWQKIEPQLNALRYKHLHFSARYNGTLNGLGHNPRRTFFKNRRERYVFKG